MFGNTALLAGAGAAMTAWQGFGLCRHSSGKGTVIEYKAASGSRKRLLVLDARHRSVQKFGRSRLDVAELANFNTPAAGDSWKIVENPPAMQNPIPAEVTDEAIYRRWSASLAADKSARANCDIWMAYNNSTDTYGIKGVPAVAWCRAQSIGGMPCDLPNAYEAMILWACSDMLDEMDPTKAAYPGLMLGHKATSAKQGWGRCQKYNGQTGAFLWSSTEHSSDKSRGATCQGWSYEAGMFRSNYGTAVPVLELD